MRVMTAIGFQAITFAGISALVAQLVSMAQEKWSAMPAAVLQLAALSGIPESLGMIFGAYAATFAYQQAAAGAARLIFAPKS